jgi:hypothetical protein
VDHFAKYRETVVRKAQIVWNAAAAAARLKLLKARLRLSGNVVHVVLSNVFIASACLVTIVLTALRLDATIAIPWWVVFLPVLLTHVMCAVAYAHASWVNKLGIHNQKWEYSVLYDFGRECSNPRYGIYPIALMVCILLFQLLLIIQLDAVVASPLPWVATFAPIYAFVALCIVAIITGCGRVRITQADDIDRWLAIGSLFSFTGLMTTLVLMSLKLDGYLLFSWCVEQV